MYYRFHLVFVFHSIVLELLHLIGIAALPGQHYEMLISVRTRLSKFVLPPLFIKVIAVTALILFKI